MINYTIKKGSHYVIGVFCHPCEYGTTSPNSAFRWSNREDAQRIANENFDCVVVELARLENGVWIKF